MIITINIEKPAIMDNIERNSKTPEVPWANNIIICVRIVEFYFSRC